MGMTPPELLQECGNRVTLCTITLLTKQSASHKQLTKFYPFIIFNMLPTFLISQAHILRLTVIYNSVLLLTHLQLPLPRFTAENTAARYTAVTETHWIRKNKLTLTKGHADHPDGHIFPKMTCEIAHLHRYVTRKRCFSSFLTYSNRNL